MAVEDVARDEGGVELEGGHALLQLHPHLPPIRPAEFLQSEQQFLIILWSKKTGKLKIEMEDL